MDNSREPVKEVSVRTLWIALALAFVFALGGLVGVGALWLADSMNSLAVLHTASVPVPTAGDDPSRESMVSLLWEAWDIVERTYLDPASLDTATLMRGAVRGMVNAVGDSHTLLIDPVPAAILNEDMSGEFQGIGVTVGMPANDRLVATDILPGSPAEEAGLQIGDAVIAVDGTPIDGLTMDDAIALIRGPQGTDVVLTIEREGQPAFDVTLTRRSIVYPSASYELLEEGIGYISLSEFNANADDQLAEYISALQAEGATRLVLDLRSNPGGFLDQAVRVAGEFLPEDTVVMTEYGRDDLVREYRVKEQGNALEMPLVVLIDGGSASASEIVAGALQDLGRATVLGTQSYGKGSVQTLHALSDGSQLRVTVARYALPSGTFVDGVGLTPDVVVEWDSDAWLEGVDVQLDAAVELLQNGEVDRHGE